MAEKKQEIHEVENDLALAASIRSSKGTQDIVHTTLKTDERVIARVTDGIYRQPGSSIRELISNAYDADATRVVIKTDAPRFERISVEDDGHGMSPEALAHLLLHIGGSAKRSALGSALGVTSTTDSLKSPKGRRLIGKIGIGLFSVSQLTHSFQIITKVEGDSHRTIATVVLRQYAEEEILTEQDGRKKFESGKVNIWREAASDIDAHGTSIVLTNIRPQARDTLRSREIWSVIEQNDSLADGEEKQSIDPPRFHIGTVDLTGNNFRSEEDDVQSLPWTKEDTPDEAFNKLVQCVWTEANLTTPNPQLSRIFDYYLRMVWQISLAIPLPYVLEHPFELKAADVSAAFLLANKPKGSAERVDLGEDTLSQRLGLNEAVGEVFKFDVYFDELKLSRPIKFTQLPETKNALKKPLMFIGKCREDFANLPRELSGGPLAFEAYLFWSPKIVPTEHQGSLIRIHGSSGTLFDSTFMRYQVSELNRLRQITCEIFVSEGLDSALNIDRESFNNAHPHSVYITKWLHGALRQLATEQKRLSRVVRDNVRSEDRDATIVLIQEVAERVWKRETDDPGANPPAIELDHADSSSSNQHDTYVYSREAIVPTRPGVRGAQSRARDVILEEKLKAIAQVLASFGLLDQLTRNKQESLLNAIYSIIETSGET